MAIAMTNRIEYVTTSTQACMNGVRYGRGRNEGDSVRHDHGAHSAIDGSWRQYRRARLDALSVGGRR